MQNLQSMYRKLPHLYYDEQVDNTTTPDRYEGMLKNWVPPSNGAVMRLVVLFVTRCWAIAGQPCQQSL